MFSGRESSTASLTTAPDSSLRVNFSRSVLALLLLLAASGCDLIGDSLPVNCTDNFVMGLHLSVQDSLTGAPAASGAVLITREGAYADTAVAPSAAQNPDT